MGLLSKGIRRAQTPADIREIVGGVNDRIDTLKNIAEEMGESRITLLQWANNPDFPIPVINRGQHNRIYIVQEVKEYVQARRAKRN